ncbi:MAG: 6-phosphofructokinase [Clostridiales bacterium]|nr:6-phosphofructokinase [Clostridiales bacterium]
MNPAVRAVVRTACVMGMQVFGVNHGYHGLMEGDLHKMDLRSVSDIIQRGGTQLFSARAPEFRTEEGMQKAIDVCKSKKIDGIVVIGGDGSFRGARDLSRRGIPCVALPGTIDNDIACCDYTIGYDTCLNTIVEMVDRVRDTTESHGRCTVVEVMGRSAGYLALYSGIAVGATVILIPEKKPYYLDKDVIEVMNRTIATGKEHFVIVVAEGLFNEDDKDENGNPVSSGIFDSASKMKRIVGVEAIAKEIEEKTGFESRAVILGHVQRGGSPTARDRIVASLMGNRAVKLLEEEIVKKKKIDRRNKQYENNGLDQRDAYEGGRVVAMQSDKIVDFDITEALDMKKSVDMDVYKLSGEISI